MDLQELKYLLDYAKKHNMMQQPFISVYQAWSKELEEAYSMQKVSEYGGMVDTYALGAYAVMRVGSSPTTPTVVEAILFMKVKH